GLLKETLPGEDIVESEATPPGTKHPAAVGGNTRPEGDRGSGEAALFAQTPADQRSRIALLKSKHRLVVGERDRGCPTAQPQDLAGQQGLAAPHLEAPVVPRAGDQFAVWAEGHTIHGGTVLAAMAAENLNQSRGLPVEPLRCRDLLPAQSV